MDLCEKKKKKKKKNGVEACVLLRAILVYIEFITTTLPCTSRSIVENISSFQ